jgi:hypothetical protein
MSYDPAADPRWIPDEPEREEDPAHGARIEAIQRDMEIVSTAVSAFDHPGWPFIEATLAKEVSDAKQKMFRLSDPLEFRYASGQVYAFEWLLDLKNRTRQILAKLDDDLRREMGER